jgi:hypothetical protein
MRDARLALLEIFDPDGPAFLDDDAGDQNPRLDCQVGPIERRPQGRNPPCAEVSD